MNIVIAKKAAAILMAAVLITGLVVIGNIEKAQLQKEYKR